RRGKLLDLLGSPAELIRGERGQREAVLRALHRGRRNLCEALGAPALERRAPGVGRGRDDRTEQAGRDLATALFVEEFRGRPLRIRPDARHLERLAGAPEMYEDGRHASEA